MNNLYKKHQKPGYQVSGFAGFMILALFVFLLPTRGTTPLFAQDTGGDNIEALKAHAPKVFIDCDDCDLDYIRTELTFVNYVRDRKEADVHVLITTQNTGSGGKEYTLTFLGQNGFSGTEDVHKYYSGQNDSADQVRSGMVSALKLGLIRYAARTPIASRIKISYKEEEKQEEVKDKWNHWVFTISLGGFFMGEKSYQTNMLNGTVSALRVTPDLKIQTSLRLNYNRDVYNFAGEKYVSTSDSRNFNALVVKALSDHWSIGGYASAVTSTYSNIDLGFSLAPAVEYDLFPYSDSSRRQIRFLYKLNYQPIRYIEETIYDKKQEHLFNHELEVSLSLKEKWGTISASVEGSHYFHDFSKNRVQVNGGISLNLFKGFSFNVSGGASMIHDQLGLPKGGASYEETLLRIKQLATTFDYYTSVGIQFTFGSIFTNVVNPRFGSDSRSISISM